MRIIAAGLAIYAAYLPVALFVHRDYVQPPRPVGETIEMMLKFDLDKPDRYVARSYIFGTVRFPDASKLAVYEGLTPLSGVNFTPDAGANIVRFRASDGSDPRTNGRNYWIVLP